MASKKRQSFREFYAQESPVPFYVMLGLFVLSNMLLVINFTQPAARYMELTRVYINTALLWLCPMYVALNLLLWRIKPLTILVSVVLIASVIVLWNTIGKYMESYCTVVATFLALLAYKRDFRKMLLIFLIAHAVTVLAGIVGLGLGFAAARYKLGNRNVGISLGLIYPNHLGRMVYMVMTIAWYLWGQKKYALTTALSWMMAVLMWQFVKCKTIAIFMAVFPVCWLATQALLIWQRKGILHKVLHEAWNGIMISFPFLCFLLTFILGQNRVAIHRITSGTKLYSLAMRFISAGMLFRVYGLPTTGRDIRAQHPPVEYMNGRYYSARIIDNAYIYYLVCLGVICLTACLLWLCLANWKAIRSGDHALLLLSVFMLGYGLIEIILFQFEHNFLWFYPLAAVAMNQESNVTPTQPTKRTV